MGHVGVGLKRTWDMSLKAAPSTGRLNLAFSGITLLTFMCIHLFQFRFGDADQWGGFLLCAPPYLVDRCEKSTAVRVRDIYRLEFEIFESYGWCLFYLSAVLIFCTHLCLGWQKVVPAPALDIPKRYHKKAIHIGYVMTAFVALIYVSFPIYTHMFTMKHGQYTKYPIH